jgi:hypothetical protein
MPPCLHLYLLLLLLLHCLGGAAGSSAAPGGIPIVSSRVVWQDGTSAPVSTAGPTAAAAAAADGGAALGRLLLPALQSLQGAGGPAGGGAVLGVQVSSVSFRNALQPHPDVAFCARTLFVLNFSCWRQNLVEAAASVLQPAAYTCQLRSCRC